MWKEKVEKRKQKEFAKCEKGYYGKGRNADIEAFKKGRNICMYQRHRNLRSRSRMHVGTYACNKNKKSVCVRSD
jgi:hypothetical protein